LSVWCQTITGHAISRPTGLTIWILVAYNADKSGARGVETLSEANKKPLALVDFWSGFEDELGTKMGG